MALTEHALTTVLAAEQRGSPSGFRHERLRSPVALLLENRLDDRAQLFREVCKLTHMVAFERLVARLATSNRDLRDRHRRRRVQDPAELPNLLGRQGVWRTAAPAMEGTATNRPASAVIRMARFELCLDRLHPRAVRRPGLAVALARVVAEEGTATPLAGDASDELLPRESIVFRPNHVGERRDRRRRRFRQRPIGDRPHPVGGASGTRLVAQCRDYRPSHPDLVGFCGVECCLFTKLSLVARWVLPEETLTAAAVPEFVASSYRGRVISTASPTGGKDLGQYPSRPILQ